MRRREKSQWPLDKKREISDYIVDNTADADHVRGQVSEVLFRILARRLPEQKPDATDDAGYNWGGFIRWEILQAW